VSAVRIRVPLTAEQAQAELDRRAAHAVLAGAAVGQLPLLWLILLGKWEIRGTGMFRGLQNSEDLPRIRRVRR